MKWKIFNQSSLICLMLINTKLCSKLNFTPQTSQTQTLKVILSFAAFSQTTVFSSKVSSMQKFLILVAFIVSCVSSFRFHGSSLSRSLITPVSFRNSNLGSRIQHVLYVASETSESEVIPEVSKSEQVIEAAPETKKVEEWRDPMAVAAEGKSPFADLFPGGITGGNILGFFIYGYIGYLFIDSVRIMVMNYGVTPPPL